MPQNRTRKIVITGVLGAISVLLGLTHWGFIPWPTQIALTFMHVPVIIGAILEGPWVGVGIGFIFGVFSLIQGIIAPTGSNDLPFANPLLSILPRLFIGPIAWLAWKALRRWNIFALITAGIAGSLTNTVLVLGMFVILRLLTLPIALYIAATNGLPEAVLAAILTLAVVAAWRQIRIGGRKGANL